MIQLKKLGPSIIRLDQQYKEEVRRKLLVLSDGHVRPVTQIQNLAMTGRSCGPEAFKIIHGLSLLTADITIYNIDVIPAWRIKVQKRDISSVDWWGSIRSYKRLPVELGPTLGRRITHEFMDEFRWRAVVVMHEPVPNSKGKPSRFVIRRNADLQCYLELEHLNGQVLGDDYGFAWLERESKSDYFCDEFATN